MGLGASRPDFRVTAPPDGVAHQRPLVVTLGWYGAQDRHVAKYAAVLNKEGYHTIRGTLPGPAVFSPFAWPRRSYAASLLDCIAEVDPQGERPVVLYAFSNGGGFVVEQIDQLVAQHPRYQAHRGRIAGVVFDSAPCYMALRVGATAIGHGMALPLRLLAALAFFLSVLIMTPLAPRRPQTYWRNMRDLRLGRSLYLYSADDPLCLVHKLDQLIAERRAAGADVEAVRWEESQHVAHLLKHPREYREALFGFLSSLG